MKKIEYIPFNELAEHQKKHPGLYPVFKRVLQADGQLIGEVEAYSDGFGNRYPLEEEKIPLN